MKTLLELFGYQKRELESELPRVEKAFNKLGIETVDIERAKQRLALYYDIEMEGIRKAMGLCLREMVDVLLAREEGKTKIIYGFMAPSINDIFTAVLSQSGSTCAIHLSWVFHLILGCVFDKMVPILEAAEKMWLKSGIVGHCSNVKSLLGLIATGLVPKPDLLVTSGFLCETAPKALDLLHEMFDINIFYFDTCQDREAKEFKNASRRTAVLGAKNARKFVEVVGESAGIEITNRNLLESMDARKKLDRAINKLRELVRNSDPLPMSATHDNIWMTFNSLSLSKERLPEVIDAVKMTFRETQERVHKGIGVVEKGAPRILATCLPHHEDPRLDHLIQDLGMAVVATDMDISMPDTDVSRLNDPYLRILGILRSSMSTNPTIKIPLLIAECRRLNIAGVLNRYHIGCRTVAGDALLIEDAVSRELNIPVLVMEWENFDPRVYNHEQYKGRLEVFKTMMKTQRNR